MSFTTRKSLLAKVGAGDEVSWGEFYAAYKPLVLLCGKDCGLTEHEKDELVQQVMCEIFQKNIVGKYDPDNVPENVAFQFTPGKGRFRHYMRKIVRNQAFKILKRRSPHRSIDDDAPVPGMPADNVWDSVWDREWYKHILCMALPELRNRVQPETYAAFEMYAVQGRPVKEVAAFLDLSVSSVYTAKSRCIAALKEIIKDLEEK